MIEIRLKRTDENKNVTFGELRIPKIGFGCKTLELMDGSNMRYKQSCRLPEGSYICEMKINKAGFFCPHIKYHVNGFAVKPQFDFENNHFNNIPTGFIAIGSGYPDPYSITRSREIDLAFSEACRELFQTYHSQQFVLNVYKLARGYSMTDDDYFDFAQQRQYNFIDNEEPENAEQPALEHDIID